MPPSESQSDALAHPHDTPASFAAVDIRAALARRPCRRHDHEDEYRALTVIATELAVNPRNMLQKVVETALVLCQGDTAGISLLETHDGKEVFRWEALAGVFASSRNSTMPRDASPCGVCIDENATELMYLADRCFPALLSEPRFVEALLVPFHCHGRPIGTVWVVTHRFDRKFDREDERVIRTLAAFASGGWQLWQANAELERRVTERTNELSEMNAVLQIEIEERKLAEHARSQLLRRFISAQEEERHRITREMHDQFGQQLSALMLKLSALKEERVVNEEWYEKIESLETIVKELDADVDFLIRELRPTALDDLGLTAALSQHVRNWSKHFGVKAELQTIGMVKDHLPKNIETALYRLTQEALTNIAKHATANNVDVVVRYGPDQVSLIVEDDGRGFDEERVLGAGNEGLGLIGMRERTILIGGTFKIESSLGRGTTVIIRIPTPCAPNGDGAIE